MEKYKILIEDFLSNRISAEEFTESYMASFKKFSGKVSNEIFDVLNSVFESADCYWPECLPGQESDFEISEQQLRVEVQEALKKLNRLLDNK